MPIPAKDSIVGILYSCANLFSIIAILSSSFLPFLMSELLNSIAKSQLLFALVGMKSTAPSIVVSYSFIRSAVV